MDDEASIRTLTSNMLEFLGYDAEIVDSGSAWRSSASSAPWATGARSTP